MELDQQIIDELYRIARMVAWDYREHGYVYDKEDLVQIAVVGALPLLDKYDPALGPLATFVYTRMQGAIKDELRLYCRSRRAGSGFKDCKVIRFSQLNSDFDIHLDQRCSDYREYMPEYRLEIIDELEAWRKIHGLNEKLWMLLLLRFGCALTQSDIANVLGVSKSRISQLETELSTYLRLKTPKATFFHKKIGRQKNLCDNSSVSQV